VSKAWDDLARRPHGWGSELCKHRSAQEAVG
jgi:hypothetical protein